MELKVKSVLDKQFQPMSLVVREMREATKEDGQDIVIGIVRNNGYVSAYKTRIYKDGVGKDDVNFRFIERMVKALLWVRGGYKIIIAGSPVVGEKIKAAYAKGGLRDFDNGFMARCYEHPFEVEVTDLAHAPVTAESTSPVGRHLNGCRIGFDAGGSDRKVSAVIDGESVYSEEVVWFPKLQSDPKYHHDGVYEAMKTAASHMPRVDAIGVSSAGVYVDNKIMIGSLFLKVSDEDFEKHIKHMYTDIAKELSAEYGKEIPIEVANDGDVTALAGAIDLNDTGILGIAMGTSEAGGYINTNGTLNGWLSELAFVPVDYNKNAMVDEWSGDYGCGVKYFSQDSVIKLAEYSGYKFEEGLSPAEKLKVVQKMMAEGDKRAAAIYEDIGIYLGYTIAFYSLFYQIKHLLLLGRVTSGKGGDIIIEKAKEVIANEFPEYASVSIEMPDENNRRVGQSIAAASLTHDNK